MRQEGLNEPTPQQRKCLGYLLSRAHAGTFGYRPALGETRFDHLHVVEPWATEDGFITSHRETPSHCGFGPADNSGPFPCSDAPLIDTTLSLPTGGEGSFVYPGHPGMGMIGDLLSTFPQLATVAPRPGDLSGIPRVRVVIDPATAGLRFWAFVSVTNNVTQHVTLVAPN